MDVQWTAQFIYGTLRSSRTKRITCQFVIYNPAPRGYPCLLQQTFSTCAYLPTYRADIFVLGCCQAKHPLLENNMLWNLKSRPVVPSEMVYVPLRSQKDPTHLPVTHHHQVPGTPAIQSTFRNFFLFTNI